MRRRIHRLDSEEYTSKTAVQPWFYIQDGNGYLNYMLFPHLPVFQIYLSFPFLLKKKKAYSYLLGFPHLCLALNSCSYVFPSHV